MVSSGKLGNKWEVFPNFFILLSYVFLFQCREDILTQLRSLIFSFDALSTVLIYVMPKFFVSPDDMRSSVRTSGIVVPPSDVMAYRDSAYKSSNFNTGKRSTDDDEEVPADDEAARELESLKALLAEKEQEIKDLKASHADDPPNSAPPEAPKTEGSSTPFLRVDASGSFVGGRVDTE